MKRMPDLVVMSTKRRESFAAAAALSTIRTAPAAENKTSARPRRRGQKDRGALITGKPRLLGGGARGWAGGRRAGGWGPPPPGGAKRGAREPAAPAARLASPRP